MPAHPAAVSLRHTPLLHSILRRSAIHVLLQSAQSRCPPDLLHPADFLCDREVRMKRSAFLSYIKNSHFKHIVFPWLFLSNTPIFCLLTQLCSLAQTVYIRVLKPEIQCFLMRTEENIHMSIRCSQIFHGIYGSIDQKLRSKRYACHGHSPSR